MSDKPNPFALPHSELRNDPAKERAAYQKGHDDGHHQGQQDAEKKARDEAYAAVKGQAWTADTQRAGGGQEAEHPSHSHHHPDIQRTDDGSFAQNMPARGRGKGNETIGPERAPTKPNQFALLPQEMQDSRTHEHSQQPDHTQSR